MFLPEGEREREREKTKEREREIERKGESTNRIQLLLFELNKAVDVMMTLCMEIGEVKQTLK